MVQYCRKCGKELSDDAEFCDGCGFQLDENLKNNTQVVKQDSENKNEFKNFHIDNGNNNINKVINNKKPIVVKSEDFHNNINGFLDKLGIIL